MVYWMYFEYADCIMECQKKEESRVNLSFFFARVSGKVELASTKMTNSEKGVDLGGSNWNERSFC